MDLGQVDARQVQSPRTGPRGQHELGVRDRPSRAKSDGTRVAVDLGDRVPEPGVDLVIGVPVLGMHVPVAGGRLALQVVLGQARPFVRSVALLPDEGERLGESFLAQGLDQRGGRKASTDDDTASWTAH